MKTDTHIAPQEPVYCGIDLHSNNLVLVVQRRLFFPVTTIKIPHLG
jgi:hypothetical protein